MAGTNNTRFIIKRTDVVGSGDDIVLEATGLTIGRLKGNLLDLNHPSVSRTHAEILDPSNDPDLARTSLGATPARFLIVNRSEANWIMLNKTELITPKQVAALADGDVIQIGRYVLRVSFDQQVRSALIISVNMQLDERFPEEQVGAEQAGTDQANVGTQILDFSKLRGLTGRLPAGAASGGYSPSAALVAPPSTEDDQMALDVFWDKRKREAGKIEGDTPLHPKTNKKLGKARSHWYPTLDLKDAWRKGYFAWGAIITTVLAVAAAFVYTEAYSAGPLADPHRAATLTPDMQRRNLAVRANANSCSTCHTTAGTMQQRCEQCHTTEKTAVAAAYSPAVYEAHEKQELSCQSCHTEHLGAARETGLIRYDVCYNCHNGTYKLPKDGVAKAGGLMRRAGDVLPIPHGGTIGYPVENGQWKPLTPEQLRRRPRPPGWEQRTPMDQFHEIHRTIPVGAGRSVSGPSCGACHVPGKPYQVKNDEALRDQMKQKCGDCHGLAYAPGNPIQRVQANCNTCHQQHNRSEELARLIEEASKDTTRLRAFGQLIAAGGTSDASNVPTRDIFTGTASAYRQDKNMLAINLIGTLGGVPWYVWLGLIGALPVAGLAFVAVRTARSRSYLDALTKQVREEEVAQAKTARSLNLEKLKQGRPPYPHPVIITDTCIGCHACVDACPHDVLKMVGGKASVAEPDQCMEDTSCQVECPTNPKSCIVINTNKKIPPREVPERNLRLETNVPGVYMTGDVSGTPLIKNAINEGRRVIDSIKEDLTKKGRAPGADYDVAIIGVGPAGLSAAVLAQQEGLSYVAIEQDVVAATIQQTYEKGKKVYYTPAEKEVLGGIPLVGAKVKKQATGGVVDEEVAYNTKEDMLAGWFDAMKQNGVKVNEQESCIDIKQENGIFTVLTEQGSLKEPESYKARKVLLAIGNRGVPRKLGVPGEDRSVRVQRITKFCAKCGTPSGIEPKCQNCGAALRVKEIEEGRVQYKLSDPKYYVGKNCAVVGAGNSAIEVAISLAGYQRDEKDNITFTNNNQVTLIVRSDFSGDLNLASKIAVNDCMEAGKIKAYFGCGVKEITEDQIVIMKTKSKEEVARVPNDFVFALIGGEKPTGFLQKLGVKIGSEG